MTKTSIPQGALISKIKGHSYVYFPQYFYDKNSLTKTKCRHRKLYIGKLDDKGNFLPNKVYAANSDLSRKDVGTVIMTKIDLANVSTRGFGPSYLLAQLARREGLVDDLVSVYGHEKANLLISLSQYWILNQSSSLYLYPSWAQDHCVETDKNVDSPSISRFLAQIGQDADRKFELFKARARRIRENEFLSYDSCKIGSEASNITDVRWAPSKSGAQQEEIGLAILCGHKSRMPVMYRILPGNMADVKTVYDMMCQWDELAIAKDAIAVLDRGYNSQINLGDLSEGGVRYVVGLRSGTDLAKDTIEEAMASFWETRNYFDEYGVYGVTEQRVIKDSNDKSHRVWIHAFRSDKNTGMSTESFFRKLTQYERNWKQGKASKKSEIYKFFVPTDAAPGQAPLQRDFAAIDHHLRYAGFFCFVSNAIKDARDALTIYRSRDVIEKTFKNLQTDLDMDSAGVYNDHTLQGKMLLGFVALSMMAALNKAMEKPSKVDEKEYPRLYEEYTLNRVLMDLATIRLTQVKGFSPRLTEITKKQALLLRRLGVAVPLQPRVSGKT